MQLSLSSSCFSFAFADFNFHNFRMCFPSHPIHEASITCFFFLHYYYWYYYRSFSISKHYFFFGYFLYTFICLLFFLLFSEPFRYSLKCLSDLLNPFDHCSFLSANSMLSATISVVYTFVPSVFV